MHTCTIVSISDRLQYNTLGKSGVVFFTKLDYLFQNYFKKYGPLHCHNTLFFKKITSSESSIEIFSNLSDNVLWLQCLVRFSNMSVSVGWQPTYTPCAISTVIVANPKTGLYLSIVETGICHILEHSIYMLHFTFVHLHKMHQTTWHLFHDSFLHHCQHPSSLPMGFPSTTISKHQCNIQETIPWLPESCS